ncbi:hypothetical protein [Pseudomonas coleopterorum]|uniref:hypothetical protein n=1 Tax=Pseudomonas coleopterorum TaxID=1605838 RepID=UPI0008974754|nr:hypothetical protein [Pseudomonas coleopterorum]SEE13559.1 hypothetical protein SAMN05216510_1572 [Pseudomonas coleopterorum]
MAASSITVTIRIAWWVNPYISAVNAFAAMAGMTPDVDKVVATAMRGVKFRFP